MSEISAPTLTLPEPVRKRLEDESTIWLTTVDGKGGPVPTPVWFLWSDGTFLIFSRPGTAKLANIAVRPRVALNFDGDGFGGNIAVFTGTAVAGTPVTDDEWERYVRKYEEGMRTLEYGPDSFRADYSVPVRVTPQRFQGW